MRAACPTPASPIDTLFRARCPGRSRLTDVSLGRTPSLHKLRRLVVFVRSLHRYYGSVRLPNTVHTGITDLPSPAVPPTITSGRCWGLSVLVHETSRSPGSRDSARSDCHSPFASQPILPPPWHHKSSTWKPFLSKLNSPACAPLSTLRQPVTRTRRMTRGRGGWLALPRTALSSAVSCRFIPDAFGASHAPAHERTNSRTHESTTSGTATSPDSKDWPESDRLPARRPVVVATVRDRHRAIGPGRIRSLQGNPA